VCEREKKVERETERKVREGEKGERERKVRERER
jgi:hypothetical protein